MTEKELEAIIESLTRTIVKNLDQAIDASGNAINRSMPLYVGSETHIHDLTLSILRDLNRLNVFVRKS